MADSDEREEKTNVRWVFLDPSAWSVVRVVFIVLVMLSVWGFFASVLSKLTYLFFLIVLSVFFAYLINPLVQFIRRPFKERGLEKLMPRAAAILVAYLIVFTFLGVAIANLAPRVTEQAAEFARSLPGYAQSAQEGISRLNQRFEQLNVSDDLQKTITENVGAFLNTVANLLTAFAAAFALSLVLYSPWLVLVPILSFLFLKDVNLFRATFLRMFPSGRWRARAESVLSDVNSTLAAYTRAQLISCFIIGTICTVGFYLLGIKYALLFGILAGILEFIPLIGPLTVGITVTTTALFGESPWKALYVAAFLITLRIIHDYFTYPRIVREGIHLHPLAIILSVLAGEQVAGIAGVFLSIPIVAIGTVFYKHILEHRGNKGLFAGWLEPKEVRDEVQ